MFHGQLVVKLSKGMVISFSRAKGIVELSAGVSNTYFHYCAVFLEVCCDENGTLICKEGFMATDVQVALAIKYSIPDS
jgi:hypothetical protein